MNLFAKQKQIQRQKKTNLQSPKGKGGGINEEFGLTDTHCNTQNKQGSAAWRRELYPTPCNNL